ncbi:MAG: hypothetical protein ACRCV3_05890 [Desulfovibrionaceae bacterium]
MNKQLSGVNLSNNERIHFVNNLIMPAENELRLFSSVGTGMVIPKFEDFSNQLTITPGSITVGDSSLSGQQKEDIANATLLAQMAADKKIDANKDPIAWYEYYTNVLAHIGFLYSDIKMLKYDTSSEGLTVEKVILEIVAAALTENGVVVLETAIKTLKELDGDSKTLTIFGSTSSSTNFNNVRVSYASLDENGSPRISLGAFTYSQNEIHETFLFFFGYNLTNLNVQAGSSSLSLNESVYSGVRDTIKKKLGKAVDDFIDNLDI